VAANRKFEYFVAPYLATMLSISFEGRYSLIEISASDQKEHTIAALIDLFVGLERSAFSFTHSLRF